MNTKIDAKSAVVGLCIGVLIALTIGAASSGSAVVGRYQIGAGASHGFVIDTVTGQVWFKHFRESEGNNSPDFAKPKTSEQK